MTDYADDLLSFSVTAMHVEALLSDLTPTFEASGKICTFMFRAINNEGLYADSAQFTVAFANVATQTIVQRDVISPAVAPDALSKLSSTTSQITVQWDQVAPTETPGGFIKGYRLYMRKINGGKQHVAYENRNLNSVRQYTATNLTAGDEYVFTLQAYQTNGFTEDLDSITLKVCAQPSYLYPPELINVDTTQMELQWEPPLSCGGCSIVQYTLYKNDGSDDGELLSIDTSDFTSDATKTSHTVSGSTHFPTGSIGKVFTFKLEVTTEGGTTQSAEVGFTLASIPTLVSDSAPTSDTSVTSHLTVKVDAKAVDYNGGSDILSYSMEYNDGNSSDFSVLYGVEVDTLLLSYTLDKVVAGKTYRFRYRSRNAVGWSAYSKVGYITAMSAPSAPSPPQFVQYQESTNNIELSINFSTENNGGVITSHELYRNDPDDNTQEIQIASYDGVSSSIQIPCTVATGDGSLDIRKTYKFKVRAATNSLKGDFSYETAAACARLPTRLVAPTHVKKGSTQTRIKIAWTAQADLDIPGGVVTGYKIYMAVGAGGSFSHVYNTASTSTKSFTATGLTPGQLYRFRVSATNFNGESQPSLPVSIYA